MDHKPIERFLWHATAKERVRLSHPELLEIRQPLVILGEAGMGKTTILKWLAANGNAAYCTARQLINRPKPSTLLGDAELLVIDALDELSLHKEGDGVGLVLRQLGEIGHPRFAISCRVADWRSATGTLSIMEQYEQEPLELHLEPFSEVDAEEFLNLRLGPIRATEITKHLTTRGLSGLLGNPQTLDMVAQVAAEGPLPNTKGELFRRATRILVVEHKETKYEHQLAEDLALNLAGAAFAGLLVTGNEAIVRGRGSNLAEGHIRFAEIVNLAGDDSVGQVINARLFKAEAADTFTYCHRRVGEFVGAAWLARKADTPRKRRRLLRLFHSHGLVPSSLRGIHAWLARDPALAHEVIAADPMGLIEYGDADDLNPSQARALLKALGSLATANPSFWDWGPYSLRGIAQETLVPELRQLIIAPDTPVGLLLLVLRALKDTLLVVDLEKELKALLTNSGAAFVNRSAAGRALISLGPQDWTATYRTLRMLGDERSLRLALELMGAIGYEGFDDALIAELIVEHAKHRGRTGGVLLGFEKLPVERLDGFLDCYSDAVTSMTDGSRQDDYERTRLAYKLITRRVEETGVEAGRLWSWLQPFKASATHNDDSVEQLAKLICEDDRLRRAVQHLVIVEQAGPDSTWSQAFELFDRSAGFRPRPGDIAALLSHLDPQAPNDQRWRDIIQLVPHSAFDGIDVRAAALPFASASPDGVRWLDSLADAPGWKLDHQQREAECKERQALRLAETRAHFASKIDAIRRGDQTLLITLAKGYLGLFEHEVDTSIPPPRRLAAWLGIDIENAAKRGFEVFLTAPDRHPTADEIVTSAAQGKYWPSGHIITVALAERVDRSESFDDLTDDALLAGLFELRRSGSFRHFKSGPLNDAVDRSVRARGLWPSAMRRYYEPRLELANSCVDLHLLMRGAADADLGAELAAEWLMRFPNLPEMVEAELIDRLVTMRRYAQLRSARARRTSTACRESQNNWLAIDLLTQFAEATEKIAALPPDPALLWHVRDRLFEGRAESPLSLGTTQLEWLVAWFRPLWPAAELPDSGWGGDTNPWDARRLIDHMIRHLGNDPSHEATTALNRLLDVPPDEYTETIQMVIAEQRRIRVESAFTPPTLGTLAAILSDSMPIEVNDFQSLLIEELALVQAKVRSDDADSWRGFYNDSAVPHEEERCRDHLIGLLRQGAAGVTFDPEAHVSADKEVDIGCSAGALRIPIEIKGQWHPQLWTGADKQLDKLYVSDWRAVDRGIYLVLWFGSQVPNNKRLRGRGRAFPIPRTPHDLRSQLAACSQAASQGRVAIVVLDLSHD